MADLPEPAFLAYQSLSPHHVNTPACDCMCRLVTSNKYIWHFVRSAGLSLPKRELAEPATRRPIVQLGCDVFQLIKVMRFIFDKNDVKFIVCAIGICQSRSRLAGMERYSHAVQALCAAPDWGGARYD